MPKRNFTVDLFSDDEFDDDFDNEDKDLTGYNQIVADLTQRNTIRNSGEKKKNERKNEDSPVISNGQISPMKQSMDVSAPTLAPTLNPMVVCFICRLVFKSFRRPVWKEFKLERPEEQCDKCCNKSVANAMNEWQEKEKARLGDQFQFKNCTILVQGEMAERALKRPIKKPISISALNSSSSSHTDDTGAHALKGTPWKLFISPFNLPTQILKGKRRKRAILIHRKQHF